MKSGRVKGGAAIPAVIDTGRRTRSNMAQPVFNASGLNRGVQGGAAQNIIQITSDDLVQNGGQYKLIGGAPLSMEIVTGRRSKQGAATVVYPVDMLGNYDPTFAGYIYKVLTADSASGYDPSSLIQFLPQNELSGGVSIDHSGLGHNGAYTAVTLGQPGVPGLGMSAAGYDGATSFNNVYSASLNAAFNGAEGTILARAQMSATAWADGQARYVARLYVDGTNNLYFQKSPAANTMTFSYTAGGTAETHGEAALTTLEFVVYAMSWSISAGVNGEVRYYIDGAPIGAVDTALGVWAGNLNPAVALLGSANTGPALVHDGNIAPYMLYGAALPPAAIAYLSTP